MAHFAELNDRNQVLRVLVINDNDVKNNRGQEQESVGVAYCKSLFGENTKWIQTSYNANIRGKYAGIGDVYDEATDQFIDPNAI
jgi:hypothetical protein